MFVDNRKQYYNYPSFINKTYFNVLLLTRIIKQYFLNNKQHLLITINLVLTIVFGVRRK